MYISTNHGYFPSIIAMTMKRLNACITALSAGRNTTSTALASASLNNLNQQNFEFKAVEVSQFDRYWRL